MALRAGQVVAGYRIEQVLGSGGMGTVYLARNPVLPRSDALKVLSSELSQDPSFRARFIREADLAATLDHPISSPSTPAAKPRTASSGSPCSTWPAATRTTNLTRAV